MRFWADLTSGVQFSDESKQTWVQLLPVGTYKHQVHGEIKITLDRVKRFAANVKNKVRGIDLDIDYDHKKYDSKAAGWIKDADARADGLWVNIEWTEPAYKAVKNKEFRYLSAEFEDVWQDTSGASYQDVLCGGGLTNRPFLKNILPINLSDLEQGDEVDPEKELNKLLGLPEDATAEQRVEALKKRTEGGKPPETKDDNKPPEDEGKSETEIEGGKKEEPIAASELLKAIKQLAEGNPVVKQLADLVESQGKQIDTLTTATRLSEIDAKLSEIGEDKAGRKYVVAPAARKSLRDVVVGLPKQTGDAILKTFGEVVSQGIVELGERGHTRTDTSELDGPAKQFSDAVGKYMSEHKDVNYIDAVEAAADANPDLYQQYRQSVVAQGREN